MERYFTHVQSCEWLGFQHRIEAGKFQQDIEVQVGDELTEDDIEKLEWDWTAEDRNIKNKAKQQR